MDFYEALQSRSSTRAFTGQDLPSETVDRLLRAACMAPTAGNLQPWRFFVVRDPDTRRALSRCAYGQVYVAEAPVVIVVCADLEASSRGYGSRGANLYAIQDTAAAVENILLTAAAEGLGSCWVGAFDEDEVAGVLGLEGSIRPLALVLVGHPAARGARARREPFEKFTKYL